MKRGRIRGYNPERMPRRTNATLHACLGNRKHATRVSRGYILPTTLRTVAALYIDPRSVYPTLPGVECWDEARDARLYCGPHPVVAHPACGPWSRLRHMYRGSEGGLDCAIAALDAVRFFGGVLEHPAKSQLWFCDPKLAEHLARGFGWRDEHGGVSYAVEQVEWGHVARKATWLYCVRTKAIAAAPYPGRFGCRPAGIKNASKAQLRRTPIEFAHALVDLARSVDEPEVPPYPGRAFTHWVSGNHRDGRTPSHIKMASAQQRRRTPIAFAEMLVRMARSVAP